MRIPIFLKCTISHQLSFFEFKIYKVLDFSSKLKEKDLCNPIDALGYFKATDYFYNKSKIITRPPANLTDQELANFNMASIICKIPKRQIISDADYLSKEINSSSITNYVSYKQFPSLFIYYFKLFNFICRLVRS